jgi:CRISPR-associated exonuclease Cas4
VAELNSLSLPLSALQHFAFCPRQCALIHVEQQWAENRLTAEGRVLHDKAHDAGSESRSNVRIARALPLQSTTLHLHGVADIVEFHRQPDGAWRPFPVEYKRGRPKHEPIDAVQLCAQAICLEEMLGCTIPTGAIFYGQTHRRHNVIFDASLRSETTRIAKAVHDLVSFGRTPAPEFSPKCRSCSFLELCRPEAITRSASAYLHSLFTTVD